MISWRRATSASVKPLVAASSRIARFCSFDQNRRRSRPAKISTRPIRPDRSVAKYGISDVTSGQCWKTERITHRTLTFETLYPDGKAVEELPYPRAKAHRQVPAHIRVALADRAQAIGAAGSAVA
jgi:hypothetical protein